LTGKKFENVELIKTRCRNFYRSAEESVGETSNSGMADGIYPSRRTLSWKGLVLHQGKFTIFSVKYEIIYELDAIEYLFVFFQLDMFRAYTPNFRSNGSYNFFTYAAYGVL